ncbi:MAG TPA: tetratricopeptide repeat protein [Polyangia bacterium]
MKTTNKTRIQTVGVAPAAPSSKIWAAAGLLVVAVGGAYANSFHGPFVLDDTPSIVENQSIRHLGSAQVLAAPPDAITTAGRPVVNLSLAVNYAIGGLAVEGYHVLNLAIHILAALALFGLVRRTLLLPTLSAQFGAAATGLALAVALLWAVHPLQTESVTYIVQRAEAMVGLLYFLTIYCLLRGAAAARGSGWYAAALGTCALGMASKEVMVSAPVVALLYDRIFIAGSFGKSLQRRRGLWLALASTWVLLALLVYTSHNRAGSAGFGLGITVWEYARTQFGCIVHYLRLAFWPSQLVLDYGAPVARTAAEIVPYAIAVFVLVAATVAALALRPKLGFLGVWFFAILAPTSSIVPLPGQTEAEHRMYLALAAVVVLVVLAAYLALGWLGLRSRRAGVALIPAVAVVLGWGTYRRNQVYQSELAIWDSTIQNFPLNQRAYLSRGKAHDGKGQYDAAIRDYDDAIRLRPDYAEAYNNRGAAYEAKGQVDTAIKDYDKAIALQPGAAEAYCNRGNVHQSRGQYDAAIKDYDKAIELKPNLAAGYQNRAIAYSLIRAFDKAWADVRALRNLGGTPNPLFVEELTENSGRSE